MITDAPLISPLLQIIFCQVTHRIISDVDKASCPHDTSCIFHSLLAIPDLSNALQGFTLPSLAKFKSH